MNFIRALNAVLERISLDEKLNPTHVALYLALFHSWNQNRFRNPFSINRDEIRQVCKIGSKHTYHKCLWDLHHWGYIEYLPSYNPVRGSKINLYNFDTGSEQVITQDYTKNGTGNEQVLPPSLNSINIGNNKTFESKITCNSKEKFKNGAYEFIIEEVGRNPTLEKVQIFFKNENWPEIEAKKFYNYFESNGWKVGGKTPMKNWLAAARNWMLNTKKFENPKNEKSNLSTSSGKDYSEPL